MRKQVAMLFVIGMIGLGLMGMNMSRRLLGGKHEVVVFDRAQEKAEQMEKEGAIGAASLDEMVQKLSAPRVLWIMLPAGKPVDATVEVLSRSLSPGDIVIDGGNSNFKDDLRRAEQLKPLGIHYMDAGVSGGIWGLEVGYCTMVGGDESDFRYVEPIRKVQSAFSTVLYEETCSTHNYFYLSSSWYRYSRLIYKQES